MGLVEVGVSVYSPEWLPRTNRATHSLTHKVSVDADLVSFDAALVDAGRREGAECAVIPAVTDLRHLRVRVLTRGCERCSIARRRRSSASRAGIGD